MFAMLGRLKKLCADSLCGKNLQKCLILDQIFAAIKVIQNIY